MKKIIKCKDTEFTIYVEDTDFQGVVYHANYLKYFERSRSEFLFDSGIKDLIKLSSLDLSKHSSKVLQGNVSHSGYIFLAQLSL